MSDSNRGKSGWMKRIGRGECPFRVEVENASVAMHDAGYRSVESHAMWVPTDEIRAAVIAVYPESQALAPCEWGYAVWLAFPDSRRVQRSYHKHRVWGYAGITGPGGIRAKGFPE